ncbi:hypothetical protein [Brevundimonas aveniformis]|uniref:hypothetical protein n=1 Tax=Brevundimonas aveniformis TaxID=370977 RepID=UPI00249016A6|nr:hypothetical protein [Brevundimonas aveniformis]
MRLMLTLTALTALSLAACEPQSTVEAEAPDAGSATTTPSETAPPMELGGVDLAGNISVLGTEPFWAVGFEGTRMVYSGVDRPEQRAPRPAPEVLGTTATWQTTTAEGNDLTVSLMATECSDGMSDRTYPLTAQVEIAGEELVGCAAATEWLHSTDESGAPREG